MSISTVLQPNIDNRTSLYGSFANERTFPNLGAFPGEIGSGYTTGGIGGNWRGGNLAPFYWLNYGLVRKKRSKRSKITKKSAKRSKRSKITKRSKRSKITAKKRY
jgi:hypothetical protein